MTDKTTQAPRVPGWEEMPRDRNAAIKWLKALPKEEQIRFKADLEAHQNPQMDEPSTPEPEPEVAEALSDEEFQEGVDDILAGSGDAGPTDGAAPPRKAPPVRKKPKAVESEAHKAASGSMTEGKAPPAPAPAGGYTPSPLMEQAKAGLPQQVPQIKIGKGEFRRSTDAEDTFHDHLEVVFVGASAVIHKQYYEKGYDPNNKGEAPDCASKDGLEPDSNVPNPQAVNCKDCVLNKFGSIPGRAGKACQDKKRMALVAAGRMDGIVYRIDFAPTTFSKLGRYMDELGAQGLNLEDVITEMWQQTGESYPIVVFSKKRDLTADERKVIQAKMATGVPDAVANPATLSIAQGE